MKIVILDQSSFIKKTLQNKLGDASTEVRCLNSSSAALLTIVEWHPDVVITGVEVGEINGFDLCMLLKLMPDYATVPVIIISSGEIDALQRKSADVGADYYVPKDKNIIPNVRAAIGKVCGDEADAQDVVVPVKSSSQRKPGNVLVVDDSAVMRRIIRNMLNSMGIDAVAEAEDGSEAFSIIKDSHVGLVLTDWNMPVMSGLQLIEKIRSDSQYDELPVIMVTTEGGSKEREQASIAGATDHLSKPFSLEKMRSMVTQFAEHIQSS